LGSRFWVWLSVLFSESTPSPVLFQNKWSPNRHVRTIWDAAVFLNMVRLLMLNSVVLVLSSQEDFFFIKIFATSFRSE
jgi:hypothetical protein